MPGSVADDSQMNERAEVTRSDLRQSVQPHMFISSMTPVLGVWLRPPRYFSGEEGGHSSTERGFPGRQGAQAQWPPQQLSMGFPTASLSRCGRPAPHIPQRSRDCGLCPCLGQLGLL